MDKMMRELNPDELDRVSGGCGAVNMVINSDCSKCGGTEAEGKVTFLGLDSTGRIGTYRCKCGYEYNIYAYF
jgi:hypothetical protein